MSYIIKNNDPLINLKLTDTGRRNLSSGELDFSTFSLGDGEIDYSNPTSKLINILRPTDNNHDILFPVAYNGSTYKVPITSITSFPNIVGIVVINEILSGENAVSCDNFKLIFPKCHSPFDCEKYKDADG